MRAAITALLLSLSLPALAATPHYQLGHSYTLGGDGGWDYLTYDAAGKRLFISRATRVQVVDVATGKLLGEIPGTDGVHGIALAPELNKGFTTDGKDNTVTVFDLKTLKVIERVNIKGDHPDAIAYESATQRIFTFNGKSNDSTALDAKTDTVLGDVPLSGRPEAAVADGKGHVFVNIESKSELSDIDAKALKVAHTWSLAPACDSPSAIAMDTAHRRLFSGCDNKVMAVSDADTGKVIGTQPIGDGVDAGSFDPALGLVFMSCGEGVLSVIHEDSPDHYSKLEDAPTRKYARTMALDPASHAAYLVTADLKVTPAPAGATGQAARPKREVLPDSFTVLVMQRQ
ncbi:MAG TPA: YncE family protein [Gammaproteobacteria bacterium]|jgi:YVTN family beta-propeller protein